jgi:hypothetical protein
MRLCALSQYGPSVVDLCLGWPFLDLTEDSLYHEAELSSEFKCSVLIILYAPFSCTHTVFPGLANQVIRIHCF